MRVASSFLALSVLAAASTAQDLSVLDPARARWIRAEVSGDAAFEHVRFMTQFHRPRGGSDGLMRVAQYYQAQLEALGLADVQLIRQADTDRPWNARAAELWIDGDEPERLASLLQTAVHLADFSRSTDVTAELVDLGAGRDEDYEGLELAGKIVLTHGSMGRAMSEAVCEQGALGVVWYPDPLGTGNGIDGGGYARPDQIRWTSIASEDSDECAPTFAFSLSLRQGLALRERVARGPVRVRAFVDAGFESAEGAEPWQVMVEGRIPGSDPDARQDVVLTGHLQEEATSANDDASGCASTLEVARALSTLIESGRIPRPRRDLRFWFVTEISSERQYFADHPDEIGRIWVNVNQDMVGAEQGQDLMRKQNVTRLPATRFHLLNDVTEAVVEWMVAANNFELSQLQNGIALYPDPHVAHRGSWHRWNAETIFFHNNTDHMTFTEAPIGIPGVTFTNMPDRFIHSSDDDLWNIDPTQLGRSAASVALIAYTMAAADEGSAPVLAAEVVGRGAERLGRNLRLALSWIAADPGPASYHAALDQVHFAGERERRALGSLADVGLSSAAIGSLLEGLGRREAAALAEVNEAWHRASDGRPKPDRETSDAERRLGTLRPRLVGDARAFLASRDELGGAPGLHSLMAFEVRAAIDGQRSGLAIARLVAAEAREAGVNYFGTVTPEAVLTCLESAAGTGLFALE